jgi:hypothetical protein
VCFSSKTEEIPEVSKFDERLNKQNERRIDLKGIRTSLEKVRLSVRWKNRKVVSGLQLCFGEE